MYIKKKYLYTVKQILLLLLLLVKGKAFPLQAWSGPEGSRKLRFPDFFDNGTGWWYGCQPYA
jgi:hypothetical protein